MQGSSYPSAEFDDLAAFTEGTDALTANLPNEVAAEAEAIQRTIGADARPDRHGLWCCIF